MAFRLRSIPKVGLFMYVPLLLKIESHIDTFGFKDETRPLEPTSMSGVYHPWVDLTLPPNQPRHTTMYPT